MRPRLRLPRVRARLCRATCGSRIRGGHADVAVVRPDVCDDIAFPSEAMTKLQRQPVQLRLEGHVRIPLLTVNVAFSNVTLCASRWLRFSRPGARPRLQEPGGSAAREVLACARFGGTRKGAACRAELPPRLVGQPPASMRVASMSYPATSWASNWLSPCSAQFNACLDLVASLPVLPTPGPGSVATPPLHSSPGTRGRAFADLPSHPRHGRRPSRSRRGPCRRSCDPARAGLAPRPSTAAPVRH